MTDNAAASGDNAQVPTHRTCSSCERLLERHHFSKKEYLKRNGTTFDCQSCKKRKMAERLGQPPPATTLEGRVADSGMKRRPNNFGYCNYIDRLFGMACFKDIVELGVFTSAKDVSESMAALHGALRHGSISSEGKEVHCLCIGDGSTPRSAVLAAFLKGWTCVSIDPALREEWRGKHKTVRGLEGYRGTLEDFVVSDRSSSQDSKHLVLLCVHSHARFQGHATVQKIRACYHNIPTTLVSLPCCAKFRHVGDIGRAPDVQYEDDCVFSACRKVEVWNFC